MRGTSRGVDELGVGAHHHVLVVLVEGRLGQHFQELVVELGAVHLLHQSALGGLVLDEGAQSGQHELDEVGVFAVLVLDHEAGEGVEEDFHFHHAADELVAVGDLLVGGRELAQDHEGLAHVGAELLGGEHGVGVAAAN